MSDENDKITEKKPKNASPAIRIDGFAEQPRDPSQAGLGVLQMPNFIEQKAALISAHFLLPAGSKIIDMGCETGEVTYILAHLNPWLEVIGIDQDQKMIEFARRTFKLPNLKFIHGDIVSDIIPDHSLDGIVNSNVLHHIYSNNGYDSESIIEILESQAKKLKAGGTMLIRDYMMPPLGEFVLMEFPDVKSLGDQPVDLSDADLLILFSQNARPTLDGAEGFFLEELTPRREKTRLFRLEHKWALEFAHRKDYKRTWQTQLHEEYTFFTYQDYRRELARLSMRVLYSSPTYNPWVIKHRFKGRFQLYNEDYKALPYPATNYFIVAQKAEEKESLIIEERRPSQKNVENLKIVLVRDQKTNKIHELVRRNVEHTDIIPYRLTQDKRLMVYVCGGSARPIVNAVSRGYSNIDDKKWSGHLVEPISMDSLDFSDQEDENKQMIAQFLSDFASLKVAKVETIFEGDIYYPSPDRIDEAVETVFAQVVTPTQTSWSVRPHTHGVINQGQILELEASEIIRASNVGLLPDPRLEIHVLALMRKLGIAPPKWIGEIIPIAGKAPEKIFEPEDILAEAEAVTFTEEKGKAKELKAVRSVFVDEGKMGRSIRGVKSRDVEFVITHDGIENIAVVFPLTRNWDGSLLMGVEAKAMPVPQRLGGDSAMLTAPSFILPKEVASLQDAKAFVAKKFGVTPDRVAQLGDSYFSHVGVMPQRIFPFVVAAEGEIKSHPNMKYTMARKLDQLGKFQRFTAVFAKGFARLQQSLDFDHGMAPDRKLDDKLKKELTISTQKMDLQIEKKLAEGAVKSRLKGQRPASRKRSIPETVQKARTLKGELREGYKGALSTVQPEVKKEEAPVITHQKRTVTKDEKMPVSLIKNPKLQLNLDIKEIERLQKEKKQRQEQDKSRDRNLDYTP